jgi:predicted TIM-barrel enzyme
MLKANAMLIWVTGEVLAVAEHTPVFSGVAPLTLFA